MMNAETEKLLSAATGQVRRRIVEMDLAIEKKGEAIRLSGGGQINIMVVSLALIRLDDLEYKS